MRGYEWLRRQRQETLELRSADGLTLRARWIAADTGENRSAAVILMHGYRGSGVRDFAYLLPYYHALGIHILLPDQRAHGASEGKYICYGVKERYDCRGWAELINQKYGVRDLFLHGLSLGCTTVLMAAGIGLPANVRGIVADCGYTSPDAIFRRVLQQNFRVFPYPVLAAVQIAARFTAKFGFRDASTVDAMRKCRIPILFFHGTADTFVPPEMTKQNYTACAGEKKMIFVDSAKHAESWLRAPDLCRAETAAFLAKYRT